MSFLDQKFQYLTPYVPGEQAIQEEVIKLNTNENPYEPPKAVVEAAKAASETLNRYSDPDCQEVVIPLAEHLGVAPENVIVGNGSDEILSFLFQGFMEKGAQFPDITYGFYPVYSDLFQLKASTIPLKDDLTIDLEDYAGEETVIFANPNAPTGLGISPTVICDFAKANPNRLIIIDEAYGDFGDVSAVPYLKDHPNLLVVGTFSKSRQLAGGRLGYAVGSPEVIADLNKLRFSYNPYNVNSMTLACGAASLASQDYVEACTNKIIETREWMKSELRKLDFEVTDSQTNFLFLQHPRVTGEKIFTYLKEKNIFIRWFNQSRIVNYVRISIGTQAEMEKCLAVIKQIEGVES